MKSNFNDNEIVKVNGKNYPVVGGRLRIAHEDNETLDIETTIIKDESEKAVIHAKIKTVKGVFQGIGSANIYRDAKLKQTILELAETRAIARALRFAGYGVEYTGFEEVDGKSNANGNPTPNQEKTEEPDNTQSVIDTNKVKAIRNLLKTSQTDEKQFIDYYHLDSLEEMTVTEWLKGMRSLEKKVKALKTGKPEEPKLDI